MAQIRDLRQVDISLVQNFSEIKAGEFFLDDSARYTVLPGFCDVHVHFREPGFSYKETIASGSEAAAFGGFTEVCTMPNLSPVPDSLPNLRLQLDAIEKDARIGVHPFGAITVGERGETLADLDAMAPFVSGFSDDGRGVADADLMLRAMEKARAAGRVIVAHCEDMAFVNGGCIHDGAFARAHGLRGISSESEYRMVERDLGLVEKTGCAYHVCHISTKESVELVRAAKKKGLDVTCETAPHYLIMEENDLLDEGRFKMNPPIRTAADRDALVAGLADGTIDMVATDHAPHAAAEKAKGLAGSAFGIVGLETSFPLLFTHLVKTGKISLPALVDRMAIRPRRRFALPQGNDYTVFALDERYTVDPERFHTMGRATPFAGWELYGKHCLTVRGGKIVAKSE